MISPPAKGRSLYLDFLRTLACFFVIVNHTNSDVFQAASPGGFTWLCSVTWYYLSKTAIPLFVMVSGACLLPKTDSYHRSFQRFLRMLLVLVLFSYVYYLYDLLLAGESFLQSLNFQRFFTGIWEKRITDSFWYLYFYLGLLLMLPLLQRLSKSMSKPDYLYLLGLSLGLNALWPLLVHYLPALALPAYFSFPLFNIFIGLFFAGSFFHQYLSHSRRQSCFCGLTLILSLLFSTAVTLLEAHKTPHGGKYWFMDERTAPALPVVLCAASLFLLTRRLFTCLEERPQKISPRASALVTTLGSCSFGVFLLQDMLISATLYRFFLPLWNHMNPFPAALLWEVLIFAVLVPVVWLLKKIPGLKNLL